MAGITRTLKNLVLSLSLARSVCCFAQQPGVEKAMQLVAAGNLDQAASMLLELEKADPADFEVQYRLGLVLLKQGRLKEARGHVESAAKLNPKSPVVRAALALVHEYLGKAAAARKDAPAAAKEFQEAIRIDPTRPVYYLDLAQLLLDHDTAEPAELVLQNAAQRFPKNVEVLRLLGLAKYAQGKSQEALEALLKAIDADPDAESTYASLEALLPDAQQRLPEVVAKLRSFSSRHPGSPIGHYLLALISPEESEALVRRAIQAAPNFWPAYFELYKILKAHERWDEAVVALERAIQLNPGYAPPHYALAEYYNRIGDRDRAAKERRLHHSLLAAQHKAEELHRALAPPLAYAVEPAH
jgi:tetratricopeptide (TPR) repeat protein